MKTLNLLHKEAFIGSILKDGFNYGVKPMANLTSKAVGTAYNTTKPVAGLTMKGFAKASGGKIGATMGIASLGMGLTSLKPETMGAMGNINDFANNIKGTPL